MKNETLLTVSGTIDSNATRQIVQGERPRADYFAMAKAFNADILDYDEARKRGGFIGRFLGKTVGKSAMLAWAAFKLRKQYRALRYLRYWIVHAGHGAAPRPRAQNLGL